MHSAGTQMPERTAYTAAPSASVSASAPSGPSSKLAKLTEEDQLELSERDLWEDDAEASETEAALASTSAPTLGLDTSSESERDPEPPSPDIKAFHGESQPQQPKPESPPAENLTSEDTFPEFSSRRSTDSARASTDSASAMPIAASVARHRSRRPPLRANSTFANRDGVQRRASIKMGSSAPINIPIMSRLPSLRDEETEDARKAAAFVPPHLLDKSSNNASLQQQFSILTGVSPGASVKREKLQQRNAILRRTGFIEGPACIRGVGEVMDPIKESNLEKESLHSNPSALTAALGSSPAVGSSS